MIVRSQASVSYVYSLGNLKINNLINSNTVDTEIRKVNLLGTKTASTQFFRPNDVITYNLVLTNNGNSSANNVQIKDELHHQKLIEGSFSYLFLEKSKSLVSLSSKENELFFKIEELKPHEVCIITYQAVIDDITDIGLNLNSTANVSSQEMDPTPINKLSLKQLYANVKCEKKCVDFTYLNTEIQYLLSLVNNGNAPAYDIEITDQLPQTFALSQTPDAITINKENLDIYTFDEKTGLLKLYIDKIVPNEQIEIVVKGKIIK